MSDTSERKKGVIFRLLPNKGYGFVRGDDGITRFFHAREAGIAKDGMPLFDVLREGQGVSFIPTQSGPHEKGGGWRAADIKQLEE